jgi:hypothetical protein
MAGQEIFLLNPRARLNGKHCAVLGENSAGIAWRGFRCTEGERTAELAGWGEVKGADTRISINSPRTTVQTLSTNVAWDWWVKNLS